MSRGFRFPLLTSRGHPTLMIQLFEWAVPSGISNCVFVCFMAAFPACAYMRTEAEGK